MAFNVCDQYGEHIGIIVNNSNDINDAAIVAITDLTTRDIDIDFEGIKNRLASIYKCKTLLGKINQDKLKEELKKVWDEVYSAYGVYDETYIIKLLLFKVFRDFRQYIEIEEDAIKGYILLDTTDLHFYNREYIMLQEDLGYIHNRENVLLEKPLYCKIIDYPVLSIDIMGAEGLFFGGGLADLGGMNHAHETKLKILSGDVIQTLEFPVHMSVKKGMYIDIYFEGEKIKGIFCDGMIYSF